MIRSATLNDLDAIQRLLKSEGLPYEDCGSHLQHFLVFETAQQILAVGGLEVYAQHALLRSLAVAMAYQGQGLGSTLYVELKNRALSLGVEQLFVLTETAIQYFTKRGFKQIDRGDAPGSIKNTKQFSLLCPQTAVVMCLSISG